MTNVMTKIEIIMNPNKLDKLKNALNKIGITGITVTNAMGCGLQKGHTEYYRGVAVDITFLPKIKVETVVCDVSVDLVIETASEILRTGNIGDGKIFTYELKDAVRLRTGERGPDAIRAPK